MPSVDSTVCSHALASSWCTCPSTASATQTLASARYSLTPEGPIDLLLEEDVRYALRGQLLPGWGRVPATDERQLHAVPALRWRLVLERALQQVGDDVLELPVLAGRLDLDAPHELVWKVECRLHPPSLPENQLSGSESHSAGSAGYRSCSQDDQ